MAEASEATSKSSALPQLWGRDDHPMYRVRWRDAIYAGYKLARNPDDTGQYGKLVDALTGKSGLEYARRFMQTSAGQRLYQQKPDIVAALRDRQRLHALPTGTLGKTYAEFADAEGISADGLIAALHNDMPAGWRERRSPEENFLGDWMRDTHDLYHLVLGYHTDLLGELCVLTFTGVQTRHQGVIGSVAPLWALTTAVPPVRRLVWDAIRRARRAKFFPAQNWVELLEQPVEQIRRDLNVGPIPKYKPIFSRKVKNPKHKMAN